VDDDCDARRLVVPSVERVVIWSFEIRSGLGKGCGKDPILVSNRRIDGTSSFKRMLPGGRKIAVATSDPCHGVAINWM
jgi:hypothetical protein